MLLAAICFFLRERKSLLSSSIRESVNRGWKEPKKMRLGAQIPNGAFC